MLGLFSLCGVWVLGVEVDVAPEPTKQEGNSPLYWKWRTQWKDKLVCNSAQFTSTSVPAKKPHLDTRLKTYQSFHTLSSMLTLISILEKSSLCNCSISFFSEVAHLCQTPSTWDLWRRESQVLVTVCEKASLTFEFKKPGSKANILHILCRNSHIANHSCRVLINKTTC